MPDEVNFVDLVALTKIVPGTVVEKFGGMINSSSSMHLTYRWINYKVC